jgi:PAS domain S-box-containing protein
MALIRRSQRHTQLLTEEIRRSEKWLSRTQQIAHLGSWELDLVENELHWSDEVYIIFGLEPQEFGATYEAFLESVHPDDRAAVDAAYSSSVQENKQSYEIEHRVARRFTGEIRWVHEKCERERDDTGRVIRSVGMVHDITARKQAEERFRVRLRVEGIGVAGVPVSAKQHRQDCRNPAHGVSHEGRFTNWLGCGTIRMTVQSIETEEYANAKRV